MPDDDFGGFYIRTTYDLGNFGGRVTQLARVTTLGGRTRIMCDGDICATLSRIMSPLQWHDYLHGRNEVRLPS